MKNSVKILVAALIMLFFLPFDAISQRRFTEHGQEQGLIIEQRWRRSKIFKKDSDAMLVLKITNTLDHAVNAKISVGYYSGGILTYVSEEQIICLEAGQTKRGGKAGLRFLAEEITIADTKAEDFSWDFAELEVVRVDACK